MSNALLMPEVAGSDPVILHTHQREKHGMADWREGLQHAMYPVLTRLLQEGSVLPLCVTCVGRNGSMICGRYDDIDATGLDFIFLASHIEGEAFPLPIHMLIVDQRGAAAHVQCDSAGRQDAL